MSDDEANIDDYDLMANPGHLMRRAQQLGVATYADQVGREIRPRQFALLLSVYQNPCLHQVDYMPLVGMDRSTISDVVDRLEKRSLLERRKEDGDDRTSNLYITAAGQDALVKILPQIREMERRLMARLPKRLHASFLEALKHLAQSG